MGNLPEFPPDAEAQVRFLRTDEGGRTSPVRSGYRPQFYYLGANWDAVQAYPDVEEVLPGDEVRTLLWFLSPGEHVGKVRAGLEFEVREGARVMGRGTITRVLELEEHAIRMAAHGRHAV